MASCTDPKKRGRADVQPPRTRLADKEEADADPEFLALTPKQRRAIDRAFDRGIATLSKQRGRASKRRRLNPEPDAAINSDGGFLAEDNEGGFVPDDEGGFVPDEQDDAGGFLPDEGEDEGGFMPDDDGDVTMETSDKEDRSDIRIPLSLLPTLLGSLGLPADEDVLAVFRSSASGWSADTDPTARRRKAAGAAAEETEGGVKRKDFRAVCAALMGLDQEGEEDGSADEDEGGDEAFELSDTGSESSLSSLSGSSYAGPTGRSKGKGKEKASTPPARTKRGKKLEVDAPVKLSSRQKEAVKDIWEMLKPPSEAGKRGHAANVLGRDEVKKMARTLGEMWSEDEVSWFPLCCMGQVLMADHRHGVALLDAA